MARPRWELQDVLEDILASRNVYYQPPANIRMQYPAIVYSRTDIWNTKADNINYRNLIAYNITVIDKNPDSLIVTEVSKLPYCRFGRHYVVDNLNHDTFTLYF